MEHPPAPWWLHGGAVFLPKLVDTSRARTFVPAALSILSVLPGKTLGGVYLAVYGGGSSLEYSELIVIPGLVRQGRRIGAWISHIYVDDPRSVAGGREIWGIPKELAEFRWGEGEDGPVSVKQGERVLCTFHPGRPLRLGRIPVYLPAFGRRGENLLWFRGSGAARLGIARGGVDVPQESPFTTLRFGRGLVLHLRSLKMTVHAPVCSTRGYD